MLLKLKELNPVFLMYKKSCMFVYEYYPRGKPEASKRATNIGLSKTSIFHIL